MFQKNRFLKQSNKNINADNKMATQLNIKHSELCKNNVQNEEENSSSDNEHVKTIKSNKLVDTIKVVKDVVKNKIIKINRQSNDNNDDEYYNNKNYRHHNSNKMQRKKFQIQFIHEDALYPVKQFKMINSLTTIDETGERCESKSDFCHHGYQNGCTAMIPSPKTVSQKVFMQNWLHKMEILQQQEINLTERESHLLIRENEVFRKVKELEIVERELGEKLSQVQEQQKHYKDIAIMQKRLDKTICIIESKLSDNSNQCSEYTKEEDSFDSQLPIVPYEDKESNKKTNLTYSKNYPQRQSSSYSSMRYKERPKVNYSDLDSTLSADIEDSRLSTSKWFNPENYKKPCAFTRSTSKKRFNQQPQVPVIEETLEHAIEEDKIFQKLSENMCVSQDKDTRFQNYGLIDSMTKDLQSKVECLNPNSKDNISTSQHILKTDDKHQKQIDVSDRPTSWNEKTDQWLQKKRQEYNLAIKKSTENKENHKCNVKEKKYKFLTGKKNKIFTLFR